MTKVCEYTEKGFGLRKVTWQETAEDGPDIEATENISGNSGFQLMIGAKRGTSALMEHDGGFTTAVISIDPETWCDFKTAVDRLLKT